MKLRQILAILRFHYKAALVTFFVVIATGITVVMLLPKQYVATTSLVFDVKSPDPVAGTLLPVIPGYMATQLDIIKSDRVTRTVVRLLKLDQNPVIKEQWANATSGKASVASRFAEIAGGASTGKKNIETWLSELLLKGLQANASTGGSNIISISYTASDPTFAALIANAFAQTYIDANIELRVDPARQYARWFGEQGKVMRENLEKAQAAYSNFQQQNGIVAKDEQLDAETAKLTDLYVQLSAVQGQTAEAQSKQKSGADTLPDVMQNTIIQSLKTDIVRQEAKLQEASGNLGSNHPQYKRMEAEIAALKQKLAEQTRQVTKSFSTSTSVGIDRESELKAVIARQKAKVLELKSQRDRLAVLQRDVDAAQAAYDSVTKRYNQTNLESQVTQTNVSVLNPATEPGQPASPNIPKGLLITALAAVLLSGAVAYLLELIDRRVRSVDDLVEMLQLPVLTVIERPRSPPRLLALLRRRTALIPR